MPTNGSRSLYPHFTIGWDVWIHTTLQQVPHLRHKPTQLQMMWVTGAHAVPIHPTLLP
jgi:hypothetical protein